MAVDISCGVTAWWPGYNGGQSQGVSPPGDWKRGEVVSVNPVFLGDQLTTNLYAPLGSPHNRGKPGNRLMTVHFIAIPTTLELFRDFILEPKDPLPVKDGGHGDTFEGTKRWRFDAKLWRDAENDRGLLSKHAELEDAAERGAAVELVITWLQAKPYLYDHRNARFFEDGDLPLPVIRPR